VLNEIKKLKSITEGDDRAFIDTVDIIENCYLDLKKIKLEAEMNTATMVSEITITNFMSICIMIPTFLDKTIFRWTCSCQFRYAMHYLLKHCFVTIKSTLEVGGCEQMHHKTLDNFETREKSCNNIVNGSNLNNEGVLLMMSEVKCRQGKLNTLWDLFQVEACSNLFR
jgi:hypothetical protein